MTVTLPRRDVLADTQFTEQFQQGEGVPYPSSDLLNPYLSGSFLLRLVAVTCRGVENVDAIAVGE